MPSFSYFSTPVTAEQVVAADVLVQIRPDVDESLSEVDVLEIQRLTVRARSKLEARVTAYLMGDKYVY